MNLSDSFTEQATVCMIPVVPDSETIITTRFRTAKCMLACLEGVMVVCTSWFLLCRDKKKVVIPNFAKK
jgi:hypothetical protein